MKNLFLGLAVVAIAFSASAFTNIAPNDYLTERVDGKYDLTAGASFSPDFCQEVSTNVCSYKILTNVVLPPLPLTTLQIATLKANGDIIEIVEPISGDPYLGHYDQP